MALILSAAESWQRLQWRPASEAQNGLQLVTIADEERKPGEPFIYEIDEMTDRNREHGWMAEKCGWALDVMTQDPERAAAFADAGAHCTAIQYDHSVLHDNPGMVEVLAAHNQAGINRGPLAMGLLSGKYHDGRRVAANDVRSMPYEWMNYFRDGSAAPEWLARIDAVRDALTSDGRTLAQGALGWLWARSEQTIPIPGFRTVEQAEQNAGALGWLMDADDVAALDAVALSGTNSLGNRFWQHG
jgi:hypothetical protein